MKNLIKINFTMILLIAVTVINVSAQEWSNKQKEVWAGIEEYWDVASQNDAAGFLSYFDENYIGWSNQSYVPQSKANTSKWIKHDYKKNSTVLYTLTPVTIWVKGDFAFANYFYSQLEKNKETGKEEASSGKWTDILMKKGNKWMLVGDHGGRTSKKNN